MMVNILCSHALLHSISEEERLRAVRHVCAALPRTAQALPEQVRQLRRAQAGRPHRSCLPRLLSAARLAERIHAQVHQSGCDSAWQAGGVWGMLALCAIT